MPFQPWLFVLTIRWQPVKPLQYIATTTIVTWYSCNVNGNRAISMTKMQHPLHKFSPSFWQRLWIKIANRSFFFSFSLKYLYAFYIYMQKLSNFAEFRLGIFASCKEHSRNAGWPALAPGWKTVSSWSLTRGSRAHDRWGQGRPWPMPSAGARRSNESCAVQSSISFFWPFSYTGINDAPYVSKSPWYQTNDSQQDNFCCRAEQNALRRHSVPYYF